jgi:hypothetical protein
MHEMKSQPSWRREECASRDYADLMARIAAGKGAFAR